jgi:hypothetical protein
MRLARILVWTVGTVLVCANQEVLSAKSIPFNSRFVSPDARYAVDFVVIDKEQHFRITDLKTAGIDDSIVMPSMVLYLHWASNSQSFVTVEHIAGGSYGRLVFLKDGKWTSLEIGPPDDSMMNFSVADLQLKQEFVHFRFVVDYEKGGGIPVKYAFYAVDVNLINGETLKTMWTTITRPAWIASLRREPSYAPTMRKH